MYKIFKTFNFIKILTINIYKNVLRKNTFDYDYNIANSSATTGPPTAETYG